MENLKLELVVEDKDGNKVDLLDKADKIYVECPLEVLEEIITDVVSKRLKSALCRE